MCKHSTSQFHEKYVYNQPIYTCIDMWEKMIALNEDLKCS